MPTSNERICAILARAFAAPLTNHRRQKSTDVRFVPKADIAV
jgi:hypothetical protein